MEKKENRGGKRLNAGRKKQGEEAKKITISFVCTASQKKEITEKAKKLNISKSEYICNKLFN